MLFWAEWDPIGCGVPKDEYDSYAFKVWSFLQRSKSVEEVEAYLTRVETEGLHLPPSGRAPQIAERAVAIVSR
ncbi:MAG: hypothetical protein ACRED9_14150 [Caulobacteraceae bacterium]